MKGTKMKNTIIIFALLLLASLCAADSLNVSLAGYIDTPGTALGVHLVGDYAYVAGYHAGLQIIDISTPSAPSLTGTYNTSGVALGVHVVGDYAYVADWYAGLHVIDISTPSTPSLTGTYDTGYALGVYVSGSYAYVADYTAGLQIIDISTPSAPSLTGTYYTGYAEGVHVVGDYAYVADGDLQIIDISTPSSPSLTGTCITSGTAREVHVVGDYAYVASGGDGLYILDISYFTGIEEKDKGFKPLVYNISAHPNPFNSAVSISASQGAEIEIFDINGRMVYAMPVGAGSKPARAGGSETLPYEIVWSPVETITSGVYLVRARVGDGEVTKRVIYLK